MLETGVVIDKNGQPIYWHLPAGRSAGYLPDSPNLWDVIWQNRDNLSGIGHSHPGQGIPSPSYEDITTFAAVEVALGKRLEWWITSQDGLISLKWEGPSKFDYFGIVLENQPQWLEELRSFSYGS